MIWWVKSIGFSDDVLKSTCWTLKITALWCPIATTCYDQCLGKESCHPLTVQILSASPNWGVGRRSRSCQLRQSQSQDWWLTSPQLLSTHAYPAKPKDRAAGWSVRWWNTGIYDVPWFSQNQSETCWSSTSWHHHGCHDALNSEISTTSRKLLPFSMPEVKFPESSGAQQSLGAQMGLGQKPWNPLLFTSIAGICWCSSPQCGIVRFDP
jgi:hypothetical protein